MADESLVQILKKGNYGEQHFVTISTAPDDLPLLRPSSIRVKAKLIALTANNVSYAALGKVMKWWLNFPVPAAAPPPLNDQESYGTLPAWGWAEVLESTVPTIQPGALVYGYQPVSCAPFDIVVDTTGSPEGQFTDMAEHRRTQLPIYTRYMVAPAARDFASLPQEKVEQMAWTAILRPLWQSAYMLNRFVFSDGTYEPVHPMAPAGSNEVADWTTRDADLRSTLIVHFAASSKTAMSFTHELKVSRKPKSGPLGLLAFSGAQSLKVLEGAPFETRLTPYADVGADETLAWIRKLGPRRVVTFDYGGREGTPAVFAAALKGRFPEISLLQFIIGAEAKVHRPGTLRMVRPTVMRSNPSSQRDIAVSRIGAPELIADIEAAWQRALSDGDLTSGGLRIGEGLKGEDGVEGTWKRLTNGDFSSHVSTAFRL